MEILNIFALYLEYNLCLEYNTTRSSSATSSIRFDIKCAYLNHVNWLNGKIIELFSNPNFYLFSYWRKLKMEMNSNGLNLPIKQLNNLLLQNTKR